MENCNKLAIFPIFMRIKSSQSGKLVNLKDPNHQLSENGKSFQMLKN
jgi:hypothetical protein